MMRSPFLPLRILGFTIFILLFSSCEKEHHIRLEVRSTYLPFKWSREYDDPYYPIYTTTVTSDAQPFDYSKTQTGTVNTWVDVESIAPDSVFSSIMGAIYIDGQLAGLKMKEGYGSFDIHVTATLKD